MTPVGLFFRFEARAGREDEAARFLENELPVVLDGLPGIAWFAVRFGPTSFGIFDAFSDREGQDAHVGVRIAQALREQADSLFTATPAVEGFDVLAMDMIDPAFRAGLSEPGLR
jgi:quinol monooxygenase YgiN